MVRIVFLTGCCSAGSARARERRMREEQEQEKNRSSAPVHPQPGFDMVAGVGGQRWVRDVTPPR